MDVSFDPERSEVCEDMCQARVGVGCGRGEGWVNSVLHWVRLWVGAESAGLFEVSSGSCLFFFFFFFF